MHIKVIVNGAEGKMGKTTVETIAAEPDLQLVAQATRKDELSAMINKYQADVVIDFTSPATIFEQAQTIIENNARPIIGTTGLTLEQIETLQKQCAEKCNTTLRAYAKTTSRRYRFKSIIYDFRIFFIIKNNLFYFFFYFLVKFKSITIKKF